VNGRIFRVMLAAQARYVAPFLALAVLIAVALPLGTLQGLNTADALELDRIGLLLEQSRFLAPGYPLLAICLGAFLAVATWLPDVHWRWVYVLTLPVERTRLAVMRVVAGMLLILPVSATIWVSGLLAAKVADLPELVRAYPGSLSLRFIAGAAASYCVGSLCVIAGKRLWLVPVVIGGLILLQGAGVDLGFSLVDLIFLNPLSPFHALAGQWVLFDV
jgi:hypothetical protein